MLHDVILDKGNTCNIVIIMKVTTKGQVTIPLKIRKLLGIKPNSEVDFIEKDGMVLLVKSESRLQENRLEKLRGKLAGKYTTEQIMELTRGES